MTDTMYTFETMLGAVVAVRADREAVARHRAMVKLYGPPKAVNGMWGGMGLKLLATRPVQRRAPPVDALRCTDAPLPSPEDTVIYTTMTIEELKAERAKLLDEAQSLGVQLSPELTADFTTTDVGKAALQSLSKAMKAFKEGQAKQNKTGETTSDKKVPAVEADTKKPAKSKTAKPKAAAKPQPASTTGESKAKTAKVPATKEASVAKKAKKSKAKKTVKKGNGGSRVKFTDDAKVKVLKSENPAREGTGKFERIAKVLKSNGKTVKALVGAGTRRSTLNKMVQMKLISIGA